MNQDQFEKITHGNGLIAALDQSGGSTPAALARYGISHSGYNDDDEMFDLMHEMRTRIIADPSFSGDRILATILFEDTIDRQIDGIDSAGYVWGRKRVVPFLKVDKGLASETDGVRCMKPMPDLDALLEKAVRKGIFGTKMRSFIQIADSAGVQAVVDQQFEIAHRICATGLVPILEPEVDITSPEKQAAENLLRDALANHLDQLDPDEHVMLKLTLPEQGDLYAPLMEQPNVLRVAALSGGYSREEATGRLARNHGMIASFSRALTEGLKVTMSDAEFSAELHTSIEQIYAASIT
ncbi:fructose bisphosphate aldolase [Candidatus Mycobacterium methanotrophicum]|uniref:Fructose bisphosphate aldolase n=1 Tax=Candidatus Mycobacterium methanotrophicum TaxID=2943498 RepID=A0ABY4QMW7_9MYCO|nr:fructose bisphosphate aldolase [Candidatus Mycobacterium methanotrophicum]UQX11296.1 fructose bisphosphate aldolase [Candidatus Mycobacterium methanotrophicum]